jgi:hypothetical protein
MTVLQGKSDGSKDSREAASEVMKGQDTELQFYKHSDLSLDMTSNRSCNLQLQPCHDTQISSLQTNIFHCGSLSPSMSRQYLKLLINEL